jgi:exonuclease VII small subunit
MTDESYPQVTIKHLTEPVLDKIIERYENGELIPAIAHEYNASHQTIYRRLISIKGEVWKQAKEANSLAKYEAARDALDAEIESLNDLRKQLEIDGDERGGAGANWTLAHARERVRSAQSKLNAAEWELERVLSRIYGRNAETAQGPQVIVQVNL